jgi:hypothetical protein
MESFHCAESLSSKAHSGVRATGGAVALQQDAHTVGMALSPVPYVGNTMRYSTVGASMEGTPIVAMTHTHTTPDLTPTVSEGFSEYMARAAVRSSDVYHRHRTDVAEHDGAYVRGERAKSGNSMLTESDTTLNASTSAAKGHDDAFGRPKYPSPKHRFEVSRSAAPPQLFVAESHSHSSSSRGRGAAPHKHTGMEYASTASARDDELKRAPSQSHSSYASDKGSARPVSKDRLTAKERNAAPSQGSRKGVAGGQAGRRDDVSSYEDIIMLRMRGRESRDASILSKEGSLLEDVRNSSSLTGHAAADRILPPRDHDSRTSRGGDTKNKFEVVRDASPPGFSASLSGHVTSRNDLPSVS